MSTGVTPSRRAAVTAQIEALGVTCSPDESGECGGLGVAREDFIVSDAAMRDAHFFSEGTLR